MKKKAPQNLAKNRKAIDRIDQQILDLVSQRGTFVREIGRIKNSQGNSGQDFYVPEREALILERLLGQNPGPFSNEAIQGIFREVISASLALEAPLKVAYLGPEGTYTHMAAKKKFGVATQLVPQENIHRVFDEVFNQEVHFGIVPIENSTEGVVSQTLDLFMEYAVHICGEIQIEIIHNLLGKATSLDKVEEVYSHPQALAQCRQWLEKYLPGRPYISVNSTAKAAELSLRSPKFAAIASQHAAELYGLKMIRKRIQDNPHNFTRFIVIGRKKTLATGRDKTSLMFSTKHRPGALYEVLKPLAREGINLTHVESRPLRRKAWEYIFFIDLEGHQQDPGVARALKRIEQVCDFFQILGSYPKEVR